PYPIKQLGYLLEAPPIPMDQSELLAYKMAKICPEFPVPQVFAKREIRKIMPIPVLILDAISEFNDESPSFYDTEEGLHTLFTARIFFDYAGLMIAGSEECDTVVCQQEDVLIEYTRYRD